MREISIFDFRQISNVVCGGWFSATFHKFDRKLAKFDEFCQESPASLFTTSFTTIKLKPIDPIIQPPLSMIFRTIRIVIKFELLYSIKYTLIKLFNANALKMSTRAIYWWSMYTYVNTINTKLKKTTINFFNGHLKLIENMLQLFK